MRFSRNDSSEWEILMGATIFQNKCTRTAKWRACRQLVNPGPNESSIVNCNMCSKSERLRQQRTSSKSSMYICKLDVVQAKASYLCSYDQTIEQFYVNYDCEIDSYWWNWPLYVYRASHLSCNKRTSQIGNQNTRKSYFTIAFVQA